MAQEHTHVKCPACGHELTQQDRDIKVGGDLACANCGQVLTVQRKPEDAPAHEVHRGETLLSHCPICEEGSVLAAESEGDDKIYRCDACASVLKESFFGFGYGKLDPRFETRRSEYQGKYFTKPEMLAIAKTIAKHRISHKSKRDQAEAATDEGVEELWWQLDRDELARRKAREARRKRDVTVDDLMDEIKRRDEG